MLVRLRGEHPSTYGGVPPVRSHTSGSRYAMFVAIF